MRRFAQVAAARCAPACRSGMCSAVLPRATSCAGAVVLANGRGGALGTVPLRVPAWQRSNFVDLAGQGHTSPVRRAEGLRAMSIARDMTEDEVIYRSASVLHRRPRAKPGTHSAGCSSAGFLPPSLFLSAVQQHGQRATRRHPREARGLPRSFRMFSGCGPSHSSWECLA
jgi:hypothetical protein